VLPEDVAARQKLLEESVYDVAVERLKHQGELFAELGLGHGGLRHAVLQAWMWDWHQKLKAHLEVNITEIVTREVNTSE
jgi:DNA-directed RNA polymerase